MTDDDIIKLTAGPDNLLQKEARAALVFSVWQLFWKALDVDADLDELSTTAIDLIRAETLEEAAREMLKQRERWWPDEACAALRALKQGD